MEAECTVTSHSKINKFALSPRFLLPPSAPTSLLASRLPTPLDTDRATRTPSLATVLPLCSARHPRQHLNADDLGWLPYLTQPLLTLRPFVAFRLLAIASVRVLFVDCVFYVDPLIWILHPPPLPLAYYWFSSSPFWFPSIVSKLLDEMPDPSFPCSTSLDG
ncbi:hypothetical protein CRG98_003507 [Punica granatum]|uniref:Uncharacterized protein n=1 Tax=Punica granatum TaxID=22663 RepID=A0A2I0L7Q6_PUNGR|nr:hypothetical protein CRG98_003507 [Punica granatum]